MPDGSPTCPKKEREKEREFWRVVPGGGTLSWVWRRAGIRAWWAGVIPKHPAELKRRRREPNGESFMAHSEQIPKARV